MARTIKGERIKMATSWKRLYGGRYLTAEDVPPKGRTVTVEEITERAFNHDGDKKTKLIAHLNKFEKPWVLNVTACETLEEISGSDDPQEWEDLQIEVYRDENVRLGQKVTSGIRCRPASAKSRRGRKKAEPVPEEEDADLDGFDDEE